MTWHPKPSLTVETLHWTSRNVDSVPLLSSSDSGPWFQGNAKFTFIREHNFGPLSSSPVGRFWRCLLFKRGLTQGMRQLKPMSCIHLCVVVLEALTPAAVHSLWIPPLLNGFVSQSSPGCGLSLLLVHFFLPHLFLPFASLLMCGHRALWTASLFCNDLLFLPSLCNCQWSSFGHCQVSRLPHDCVAYRTRWETI